MLKLATEAFKGFQLKERPLYVWNKQGAHLALMDDILGHEYIAEHW